MLKFIVFLFLLPFIVNATDVQILTETTKGQGFLYSHQSNCYVITPAHVVANSKFVHALTSDRKKYTLKLVKKFDVDLALLLVNKPKRLCQSTSFNRAKKLPSLLKIYSEGAIKSKLSDGSTLQTKVDIIGIDDKEYIQIKPKKEKNILKQGYSGSVFYVANQAAGILLEVDDGSGFIYRSDALIKMLDSYFYPSGRPQKVVDEVPVADEHMKGSIAEGQVKTYQYLGERNSAVRFEFNKTDRQHSYRFFITDKRGKEVFKTKKLGSNYDYQYAFTPLKSGNYTINVEGLSGHGEYNIKMIQWTLNAVLQGAGNIIEVGDVMENRMAFENVAKYQFVGEKNSAVRFEFNKTDRQHSYRFFITDKRGKEVFKTKKLGSNYDYQYAFTPLKSGNYTINVEGLSGHGEYNIKMIQWTLNAVLQGAGNIIEVGDVMENRMAFENVAKYQFVGEKNSAVRFEFNKTDRQHSYRFFITDKRGKEVFKTKKLGSNYDYQYAFTPLKSGNYTINVEGLSGHGYYEIMLNKGHFNE